MVSGLYYSRKMHIITTSALARFPKDPVLEKTKQYPRTSLLMHTCGV